MKSTQIFLLATLALGFVLPVYAKKNLVQRRQERIEFAEEQWQKPEKVTLNVHYRVPVIEVLGYLAVNYDDPRQLGTIVAKLKPIAKRVNELSDNTYEGRSFPASLEAETSRMRQTMMADVTEVYGPGVTQQVEKFIDQKYDYLRGGIFGPLD